MRLEKTCQASRRLRFPIVARCCFASLVLAVLLFMPAESSATCTNPNPNPNPQSFAHTGDFDGDCKSDILWQHSVTGQLYAWLMNGTAVASEIGRASSGQ